MLKAVFGKALDSDSRDVVTLEYLAEMRDGYKWRQATKAEFLKLHDLDELLGVDGDSLDEEDIIACVDGEVKATEIL